MLVVVEETETAVKRRAPLAHHHAGAQDHHRQALVAVQVQQHAVADRLGARIIGASVGLGIGRRGPSHRPRLRAEVQRSDRADMHETANPLRQADARHRLRPVHHGGADLFPGSAAAAMCQVHHHRRPGDRRADRLLVADVAAMQGYARIAEQRRKSTDRAGHHRHAQPVLQAAANQVRANETSAAKDRDIGVAASAFRAPGRATSLALAGESLPPT